MGECKASARQGFVRQSDDSMSSRRWITAVSVCGQHGHPPPPPPPPRQSCSFTHVSILPHLSVLFCNDVPILSFNLHQTVSHDLYLCSHSASSPTPTPNGQSCSIPMFPFCLTTPTPTPLPVCCVDWGGGGGGGGGGILTGALPLLEGSQFQRLTAIKRQPWQALDAGDVPSGWHWGWGGGGGGAVSDEMWTLPAVTGGGPSFPHCLFLLAVRG